MEKYKEVALISLFETIIYLLLLIEQIGINIPYR